VPSTKPKLEGRAVYWSGCTAEVRIHSPRHLSAEQAALEASSIFIDHAVPPNSWVTNCSAIYWSWGRSAVIVSRVPRCREGVFSDYR